MNKETGKKKMTILDYIDQRIERMQKDIDYEKDHINQEIQKPDPDMESISETAKWVESLNDRVHELDLLWKEICSGSLDLDVNLD